MDNEEASQALPCEEMPFRSCCDLPDPPLHWASKREVFKNFNQIPFSAFECSFALSSYARFLAPGSCIRLTQACIELWQVSH